MENYLVIRETGENAFPIPRISAILDEEGALVSCTEDSSSFPQDITEYTKNVNLREYNEILLPYNLQLEVIDEDTFMEADSMEDIVPWDKLRGLPLWRRRSPA